MFFSFLEAFFTSFVVGLAENYFSAFSLHQGASALQSGLLISVPLIFAAIAQFFLQPYFKLLSVTAFVKRSTAIQIIALIGFALAALFKTDYYFYILMLLLTMYWYGHFSLQPAWNRWISEIVDIKQGQNYFSARTRLSQIGIVLGLILGGSALHLNVLSFSVEKIFFAVFILSASLKMTTYYFFTQHKSTPIALNVSREKIWSSLKKYKTFFKSYFLFNFCLYLSAPYVAGYLISERNLNYLEFMYVMISLFAGKIATTLILNKSGKQFDPNSLMYIGGLIAAPLPILWPFCSTVLMMSLVHFVSGMAWAAWEMGLSLCFFKNIDPHEKIETITLYNYLGVTTQVLGTLVGAALIKFLFKNNYDLLFITAGVLRFLFVLPLGKNKLIGPT